MIKNNYYGLNVIHIYIYIYKKVIYKFVETFFFFFENEICGNFDNRVLLKNIYLNYFNGYI